MQLIALAAKSALAVMLLAAGGAKLADLDGFAGTVRLFLPGWLPRRIRERAALGVALIELASGGVSLSAPALRPVNLVVFALGCAFVAVSAAGYAFHRGRSCRCFGALSRRKFDLPSIARSGAVAALGAIALTHVSPASTRVGVVVQVLLVLAAALLAAASFTAARALAVSRDAQPRLAPR
jgi:hypothetical protein